MSALRFLHADLLRKINQLLSAEFRLGERADDRALFRELMQRSILADDPDHMCAAAPLVWRIRLLDDMVLDDIIARIIAA